MLYLRIAAALLFTIPLLATGAQAQRHQQGQQGRSQQSAPAVRSQQSAPRQAAPMIRQVTPSQMAPRQFTPRQAAPSQVAPRQFAVPRSSPRFVQPGGQGQRFVVPRGPSPAVTARQRNIDRRIITQTGRGIVSPHTIQTRRSLSGQPAIARQQRGTAPNIARSVQDQRTIAGRTQQLPALAGSRNAGLRAGRLRNQAFANQTARSPATRALARSTFHGRFAAQGARFDRDRRGRRHFHRPFVIGWVGPLFWPYAYSDFIDYTFYPYAYDTFWPYAYDDVYEGVFGPYAVGGVISANAPATGRRTRTAARAPAAGIAQVCTERAAGLTDWPIERIAQAVEPDDAQRAKLDDLKAAASKTIELLQASCPSDLPSTPPGRMAALRQRLDTMLQAVRIVRPALEAFYASLSDEQKARFNALEPEAQQARQATARGRPDLTQVCSGQAASVSAMPMARLEQLLRPTEAQRAALEALNQATAKAAEILKANCLADETLTPPGRIAAMEQRLDAMLQALSTVQPALETFYGSLSDEQKARFNRMGASQS
jgi:hypothetical protein